MCLSIIIHSINICTRRKKDTYRIRIVNKATTIKVTIPNGLMKRRPSSVTLGIHISVGLKQSDYNDFISSPRRILPDQ